MGIIRNVALYTWKALQQENAMYEQLLGVCIES
jgi:hypothetical protein